MEKFIEIKNTVFYKNGVAESNREINCLRPMECTTNPMISDDILRIYYLFGLSVIFERNDFCASAMVPLAKEFVSSHNTQWSIL